MAKTPRESAVRGSSPLTRKSPASGQSYRPLSNARTLNPIRSCRKRIRHVFARNVVPSPWLCSPSITTRVPLSAACSGSRSRKSPSDGSSDRMRVALFASHATRGSRCGAGCESSGVARNSSVEAMSGSAFISNVSDIPLQQRGCRIARFQDPARNEDYYLIYDHPFSFESDAWRKQKQKSDFPVRVMNAGYSSGWCEESFGCDFAQGFHMARPMASADLAPWIERSTWKVEAQTSEDA